MVSRERRYEPVARQNSSKGLLRRTVPPSEAQLTRQRVSQRVPCLIGPGGVGRMGKFVKLSTSDEMANQPARCTGSRARNCTSAACWAKIAVQGAKTRSAQCLAAKLLLRVRTR